jgi:hypothetical protein
MSPMEIRILLRRLELSRLAAESAGLDAERSPWGEGRPERPRLRAADVAELGRRADPRVARWA